MENKYERGLIMSKVLQESKKKFGKNCIGNIIRIIDNRTIIVNTGKDILNIGDNVQVYEFGEPLLDIDGTTLCNYGYIKATLKVIQAEDEYWVCQKQETRQVGDIFPVSPLMEDFFTTEYVPLKVDNNDIERLTLKEPFIKIGDPIKKC